MVRDRTQPKLEPTAVDVIVTALSPALIIGMISSLVFFLVIAFYRGDYNARMMYILGLYTAATVLVARIAIEDGRAHANWFGIPLFGAACLAVFRFVSISGPLAAISPVINVGLLLLAWYLADRITYDCTLVDERDESLQQGLLQSLKLVDKQPTADISTRPEVPTARPGKGKPKRKPRKHNPGVWVLYFALLAIPLFGLGQLTIPDEKSRFEAFKYLLIYLACALSLLLTTSFVGMRRYLRQRGVEMPGEMSRMWMGYGAAGIALLLLACLILPLPTKQGVGFAWLPVEFTSPVGLPTSQWGWGNEGPQTDNAGQPAIAGKAQPQPNDNNDSTHQQPQPGQPQQPANSSTDTDNQAAQPSDANRKSRPSDRSQASSDQQQDGKSSTTGQQPSQSPEQSGSQSSSSESTREKQSPAANKSDKNSQQTSNKTDTNSSQPPTERPADSADNSDQNSQAPTNDRNAKNSGEKSQNNQSQNNQSQNPPAEAQSDREEAQQPANQPQPSAQPPTPPTTPSQPWFSGLGNIGTLVKWLLIAILAAVVLFYVLTHPQELAKLWNELLNFFYGLFGAKRQLQQTAPEKTDTGQAELTERNFSSFADPFLANSTMSPAQVIAYSFAALEAWANEHGSGRDADQTADEFARRLARQQPGVGSHATTAAQMLDRVMFANWRPSRQDVAQLEQLWQILRSS